MTKLICCVAKAGKNFDRKKSSSGAVWQVLATKCIKNGWIVYGAAFAEGLQVRHIRCTSLPEVQKTFGSKYVQSNMGGIIRQVLDDLAAGKYVLFAGTPCQVAAVRKCANENPNLFLCDIICHGVLSAQLFREYISWLETKKRAKVISFTFRDKSKGMSKQRWKATLDSGKEITDTDVYAYNRIFYSDKMFRESCYSCKFASPKRIGDLTIGDLHGYSEKFSTILNDDFGVSSVVISTKKGMQLFEKCNSDLEWIECEFDDIKQPQLISSVKKKNGKIEWKTYEREGFSGLVKKYFDVSFKDKLIHTLKDIKRKMK